MGVLIGRESDLAAVLAGMDDHRLVTIIGPGGVGKTSLARRVLAETSPGRFVDLISVTRDALVDGVLGQVGQSSLDSLVATLSDGDWLLVLDNCEHVLDPAAALVETLLDRCPRLSILATSREPLFVPQERVLRLGPLALEGDPSPAALLFIERAGDRGVDVGGEIEDVEMLCRRLDGLPLAIELAAAKTGGMTPAAIAARLDVSLESLDAGRVRGHARHRGLSAAISWSYDQLDDHQQQAFQSVSVFDGAFSVAWAAAAMGLPEPEAHDELVSLVERSLVVHTPVGGQSWFRLLETIRSYAADRLAAARRTEESWQRVVDRVIAQLAELSSGLIMADSEVPVILRGGFPTVRAVVEHLIAHDEAPDRLFSVVTPFWWLEDLGHQSETADLFERMVQRWPDPTPLSGPVYGIGAAFVRLARRLDDASRLASIAVTAGDPVGAAFGHRMLGKVARNYGRWEQALGHFADGVAEATSVGQVALALEIEMHAAMAHARSGDLERGREILERLAVDAAPYPLCRNWISLFLAWVLIPSEPDRSVEMASGVLAQPDSSEWAQAAAHMTLGMTAASVGDAAKAGVELATAIEEFSAIGNTTDIALVYVAGAAVLNGHGLARVAAGAETLIRRLRASGVLGDHEEAMLARIGGLPGADDVGLEITSHTIVEALRSVAVDQASVVGEAVFIRTGDFWEVGYGGSSASVADSKGMHDIARLLARPRTEAAALDLMGASVVATSAGDVSDATARERYRIRIVDLEADLEEATAMGDAHRAEVLRAEMDAIVDHLSAAYGLGGRTRGDADTAEKARSAVTWRIRSALKRIRSVHPPLAAHLDASLRTGRFCSYEPAEDVDWKL